MDEKIIEIKNVTMKFNLMEEKVDNLKELVLRFFQGRLFYNEFVALKNVSLSINKGDVIGFIGRNGAGKSTLLKLISGVLTPSSGTIDIKGSIAPLIEVGAGFDPELTARENIYLNGAILGHSKVFLDNHFDNIITFSELDSFVDVPVKNFSSGMYARLGFAIATEVRPDILIVDEALSVGDFQFQKKCEDRINNMITFGTTVILVSHSLDTVRQMCKNVVWIDKGIIKKIGGIEICDEYNNIS